MVVIEHNGNEYALVTASGKLQWVDNRNQVVSQDLSEKLHTAASSRGFKKPSIEPLNFVPSVVTSVKQKTRRPRRNKSGISINIDLKHDWRK
jgi:hypothetical protein